MTLENPKNYGWNKENNIWQPIFMSKPAVPETIRKLLAIRCSDNNCNNTRCFCFKEGFKCCDECKCKLCCNTLKKSYSDETVDTSDSEVDVF